MTIKVRGGRGLGDAIYVRPIAEHFVGLGKLVTVLSDYPDVFKDSGAVVQKFSRLNGFGIVVAHYAQSKAKAGTTQWQDVCASAGVTVPLRFGWKVQNEALVSVLRTKAAGRPMILVHGGRAPMDRRDGFGAELLPVAGAFGRVLSKLQDCYRVQIGRANQLYPLECDLNLNGATSVSDLLDIASVCDGVVAQCSFAIPLAEVFDKPLLAIWSARAAQSKTPFIRHTTPVKVLSSPRDTFMFDDWPMEQVRASIRAFRGAGQKELAA